MCSLDLALYSGPRSGDEARAVCTERRAALLVARVLEALALRDGAWVGIGVYDDCATARIAPFEAIELEVGRLFLPKDADE